MKLFVANLHRKTTEAELTKFFSEIGPVKEVKIIMDRETNESRGFGFVVMSTQEDAQKAIDELNKKELGGRPLVVTQAKEQPHRESRFNKRSSR